MYICRNEELILMNDLPSLQGTYDTRVDFWIEFINSSDISSMIEIGVFRGEFAAEILKQCGGVREYYMLDPWRHLEDWNKPANFSDEEFDSFYSETIQKTDFASEKISILRGKTTEVLDQIEDDHLDFAYVDGDHTLKGITIDLIRVYPKIRDGGYIGGDDFSGSIWQHNPKFEPSLVFPFAIFFAGAVNDRIFGLPHA
jgi:hypothetical protein